MIQKQYLKNKIENKYPFNNNFINEYSNKINFLNANYFYIKRNITSKDKKTQVNVIEDISKSNKNDNFISSIYSNKIFTKRKNNLYFKKKLLISEKKNNKSENKVRIINSKDNIKTIKLLHKNHNKLFKDRVNINNIYYLKKNLLDTKDLSLSKKINYFDTTQNIPRNNNEIKNGNIINNKNEEQKKINYKKINIKSNEKDINGRIKGFDVITQAGIDKNHFRKINQDNYIISSNINNIKNFNIFGVLDGHGLYGHLISIFVGRYILNSFTTNEELISCINCEEIYLKIKENNFKIINDTFINAEKELYTEEFDSNFSGTTCIIVIEIGKHIICANSGDSRAILIYTDIEKFDNYLQKSIIDNESRKELIENNNIINSHYQIKNIIKPFSNNRRCSSSLISDKIKAKNIFKENNKYWKLFSKIFCLSYDLKPTLALEKKRIYKNGGIVEKLKENDGNMNGPPRVWVKNEKYPGLAMSRSIGDFIASSVGVIPDPEIIEYTLDTNSRYMVLATDGIWEFLSNEKVMKIGNKFYPKYEPIDLCNELVKEANKRWEQEEIIRDDITVLVVYF